MTPPVFAPLLKPARYKGAYGGRGSGKSWFFVDLALEYSYTWAPFKLVCIREIQRSLEQSVKALFEARIEFFGIQSDFTVRDSWIETPGGGLIIFQGMQNHTADTIKSLEGYKVALIEEAQSLSVTSLNLLTPTIRWEERGEDGRVLKQSEIWASWNPYSEKDPIDRLFRGPTAAGDSRAVKVNYFDNPFFPDVLQKEMQDCRERDPDKYAHVWLGEYQQRSEARVFHNFSIEQFDTPDDARFYYGADWGFAKDPTVLVRCWIKGRKLFIDREAWKIGCEIDRTPALFDSMDNKLARKWTIRADSSDPQNISYMRRHGYLKMIPSVKGPHSVEQGIEFLKGYDIVIHPSCVNVIDEFSTYSYEVDPKTEEVLPRLADKKNHTIDAVRYAIEGERRGAPNLFVVNQGI